MSSRPNVFQEMREAITACHTVPLALAKPLWELLYLYGFSYILSQGQFLYDVQAGLLSCLFSGAWMPGRISARSVNTVKSPLLPPVISVLEI